MKGVILSIPTRSKSKPSSGRISLDVFVKRYLFSVIFILCFALGIIRGAFASADAQAQLLEDMDFLFNANLQSRLSAGLLSSFAAHFASNFIFFSATVLSALSPWGAVALPCVAAFKGFGTGVFAAYLISSFGIKGVGFYLAVVMPGTFIFTMVLLFLSSESCRVSLKIARCIFGKTNLPAPLGGYVKSYLFRCVYYLLISALAAVCDMLLWSFAAKLFF